MLTGRAGAVTFSEGSKCPLCGSAEVDLFDYPCFHTVDWIARVDLNTSNRKDFALFRCRCCELWFKAGIPGEDVFVDSYEQSVHGEWIPSANAVVARRFDLFEEVAIKFGNGSRVLDYGCGTGNMLYSWSDRWEKYGVELSLSARQIAAQRGIRMLDGKNLADQGIDFGAIVLIDVMEHVRDPSSLLHQLTAVLKHNGSLIIYTGTTSHWFWKWAKGGYWYCSFPEHVSFFSEKTFASIAEQFGLQLRFLNTYSHTKGPRGIACLKQLAKNLLFHGLKKAGGQQRFDSLRRGYPSFTCARDHALVVLQKQ